MSLRFLTACPKLHQNFVLAGTTLKLIDYGTLSKVEDNVGEVRHMTPTHQQPFHNNCESVDLWAAGIILLDMLLIGSIGQVICTCKPWI